MRRLAGSVLVGLGVFLIVVAALTRFYVSDQLLVTPIDQYAQTVAPGSGTYFDPGTLTEKTSDLVARRTLKGDVKASSEKVGVWDVSVVLTTGDGTFVRASLDRVAFDRKTSESVHCCGEAVDSEPARHDGVSYKFPTFTEKKTYQFWDVNSRGAYPAKYVATEKVQGLTVYKFAQQVPSHQLQTQEVPGSLVGESTPSFKAPVFYESSKTVWVEPKTGVIIKGAEQTKSTLRNSAGQDRVTVVDYTLTFDEATQKSQADLARDNIPKINLVTWIGPLVALVLGLIAVILGFLLLRPRGAGSHREGGGNGGRQGGPDRLESDDSGSFGDSRDAAVRGG